MKDGVSFEPAFVTWTFKTDDKKFRCHCFNDGLGSYVFCHKYTYFTDIELSNICSKPAIESIANILYFLDSLQAIDCSIYDYKKK